MCKSLENALKLHKRGLKITQKSSNQSFNRNIINIYKRWDTKFWHLL